jgi:LmbE family N-acetylglucosaminyl deacetylase
MRSEERFASGRILLVVAHPDDETLGAGGQLRDWAGRVHILYATDGAPRDMADATRLGCATREQYADIRRRELLQALQLAGIDLDCSFAGMVDQECYLHLPGLTWAIAETIDRVRPEWVITHAYEGGHPDHDSCAFACAAVGPSGLHEFPLYRAGGPQGWILGQFIDDQGAVFVSELDEERRALKRRMIDCHRSQQSVLQHFEVDCEVFRPAPAYDFSKPPHEGPLHYESLGWAVDGAAWRRAAADAMHAAHRS